MNRNTTAIILLILAVGIYFTFTSGKIDELKAVLAINKEYQDAIDNSVKLIKVRDDVLKAYNSISEVDKDHLNKMVPDNVDNVRLIIDVKDDIAAKHGLSIKNIKTTSPIAPPTGASSNNSSANPSSGDSSKYGVVTLSFGVTTTYDQFIAFLQDLESSLRILDISKLTLTTNDLGTYDFTVELKTYWVKK